MGMKLSQIKFIKLLITIEFLSFSTKSKDKARTKIDVPLNEVLNEEIPFSK